ncbi:unnamed protein product [Auanema sp. JU1783]|nr:unnamed protein product [Auanema sp. JU1783]
MKVILLILFCSIVDSQLLRDNCSNFDDSNWENTLKLVHEKGQEVETDEPKLLRKYPFIRDIPKFLRSKSCWSKINSTKLIEFKEKQSKIMEDDVFKNYFTDTERKIYDNYYSHETKQIRRGLPVLTCVRYERSENLKKERDTVYSSRAPLTFPICFLTFTINTKTHDLKIIDGAGASAPLQRVADCTKADSCVIMMDNATIHKEEEVEMTCCCTTHSCNSRPIILDPIVIPKKKKTTTGDPTSTTVQNSYLRDTSETQWYQFSSIVTFFQRVNAEFFIIIALISVIVYQNAFLIKKKCEKTPNVEEYSIVPVNQ